MTTNAPLSEAAFDILSSLVTGPAHGYVIMQAIEQARNGRAMQPGLLYTTLPKLLDAGWVEEVAPPSGTTDKRRKFYQLTSLGHETVLAEAKRRIDQAQRVLSVANGGKLA